MPIEVKHSTGDKAGRFFIEGPDEDLGFLDYTIDGGVLTVEHTVVTDELKGTNAARQLVNDVVEFAREKHYEMASNCSYATHIMKKHHGVD